MATSESALGEFLQRQRDIWAAGDYATLSELISGVGERTVERAGVRPGMSVLDVACGAGNVALPAARAGAQATGLDLVPELLEAAQSKADAAGLQIEWVEGDAENLPFPDDSFDRVISTFGHMFAARHRRAADEMTRVCRGGGTIAICCWTPEGTVGDVFAASASYMPPPPPFADPPILWGTEDHVREMFPQARDFDFERDSATVEWESTRSWADYFFARFGPLVTAREMLGERFAELSDALISIFEERNEATDGRLRLPQEYLLSLIRL
jgi:ubiquinone/menaquinone biosynthesis C-methylase UbiE